MSTKEFYCSGAKNNNVNRNIITPITVFIAISPIILICVCTNIYMCNYLYANQYYNTYIMATATILKDAENTFQFNSPL